MGQKKEVDRDSTKADSNSLKAIDTKKEEILLFLKKLKGEDLDFHLPLHIFQNDSLSALETIVKYLKEEKNASHTKIAKALNRNPKTIWTTYKNAQKKMPSSFSFHETSELIPVSIFIDRNLSILESLVSHLKEEYSLGYNEIALILNRDQRTVWTVHNRAKKKELLNE